MADTTSRTIYARGLTKRFGSLTAVDGLDFEARPGACLGLLGPNGAGKTTTIEMLEGLQRPDAGQITLLGQTWKEDAKELRARIGVQLQETQLPEKLRVGEVLRVFRSLYRSARTVDEMLDVVGLTDKRKAQVDTLSGGQKQRLSLGCSLVHDPEILFLDEPTTGLDPQGRRRVWEIVEAFKDKGGTVVLTTHFMEEAERLADELLIIDGGKTLTRGTPAEIVASLGAESILALAVTDAHGAPAGERLSEADVAALPDVQSVQRDGESLRIGATSFDRVLPALLAHLGALGLTLSDLEVHRPTLEDVFVSLTGRQLRDG